jgi:pimeloyl-ACP methyl ester carboxylesterase
MIVSENVHAGGVNSFMSTPSIKLTSLLTCLFVASSANGAERDNGAVRAPDGLSIAFEARGQGDTALVFLHGMTGDREYWKNQVGEFAADYHVVAVDQAGHGESGKDRKVWTLDGLAGDVEAVVKAIGLKRVILVGHSMGGPVALLAAKRMPGTVVAVIGVDNLQNADVKLPEEVRKHFLDGLAKDYKATMRGGFDGLLPKNVDPGVKTFLLARADGADPKAILGFMRDLFALDTGKLLKEARVPVRCINSAGGYKLFAPTVVETNKKYADFGAVTIDAVGHYPMLEKPAEFNRKLRGVLGEFATKK